jgi:nicotinamide mononucleotide transporter
MDFFSIEHIAFTVMQYPVSYLELIGTVSGLLSVYYASRTNILTWPTGIVNEIALFVLFFQVQLYADMFLQVYFLVVTLYGWYNWKMKAGDLPVRRLSNKGVVTYSTLLILGTAVAGSLIRQLHNWLPAYFPLPAAYPYVDAGIMTASILATILLARKQVETWVLWIAIDIVSVVLYYVKGVYFLSLEYVVFLGLATAGLINWKKSMEYA